MVFWVCFKLLINALKLVTSEENYAPRYLYNCSSRNIFKSSTLFGVSLLFYLPALFDRNERQIFDNQDVELIVFTVELPDKAHLRHISLLQSKAVHLHNVKQIITLVTANNPSIFQYSNELVKKLTEFKGR